METTKNIQYGGNCAFAISTGKFDVAGGKHRLIMDDKVYHFSNGLAKILFRILPNTQVKADKNWNSQH